MKTSVFVLACLVAVAASATTRWHELKARNYDFEQYVSEFQKPYLAGSEEWNMRKELFDAQLEKIHTHNADDSKTWKLGVNHLSDLTEAELKSMRGLRKSMSYSYRSGLQQSDAVSSMNKRSAPLPESVDWRLKGAVTPVKDQGQCGSCWTFATAEAVESHHYLATGQLFDLSPQQVASCSTNPKHCGGTGGCGGGTAQIGFEGIKSMGGLSSEWTYPYTSYSGTNFDCKFTGNTTQPAAKITGWVDLPSNQYEPLMDAIANVGPIAISVDASAWSAYETGVFNGCNQVNPDIDHAVQLVGYGTDPEHGDYFLVRNSWAPIWGELGYIRLARSSTPTCGVDKHPQDGSGCDDGPATVTACGTCAMLYDSCYPTMQ